MIGRLYVDTPVAILLHGGLLDQSLDQSGSAQPRVSGKTGLALLRYADYPIVAVIDRECAGGSLTDLTGIPHEAPIVSSVAEALHYDPEVLIIGIAPSGGSLPLDWHPELIQALQAGLSVANGLHTPLDPLLGSHRQPKAWIWDLRQEPPVLSVGRGQAAQLACRRVLMVGTDMGVGKMSASLELHRASLRQDLRSAFLATGQAGILIAGEGIPLDAVRVDFASGIVEQAVLKLGAHADIVFIEGQGSLLNPASTATLPLMRGSQPTHLVLVHRAGQTHIHPPNEHVRIPPLSEVIHLYETVARAGGAFGGSKVAGIALNTHHLNEAEAQAVIAATQAETGIPCDDVVRCGGDRLLEQVLAVGWDPP